MKIKFEPMVCVITKIPQSVHEKMRIKCFKAGNKKIQAYIAELIVKDTKNDK